MSSQLASGSGPSVPGGFLHLPPPVGPLGHMKTGT